MRGGRQQLAAQPVGAGRHAIVRRKGAREGGERSIARAFGDALKGGIAAREFDRRAVQAQLAHRIGDRFAGGLAINAVKMPGREIGDVGEPPDIQFGIEMVGNMVTRAIRRP